MTEVKPPELIFICFMLLPGFVAALNCSSPTAESLFDALQDNLFSKNLLRPVKQVSVPLNVTITVVVAAILGVDEKAQLLSTFIWQNMEWDIEGLSWDEKECGTYRITVPREKLWVPDILITEFMEEDKSPKSPYVYLYNTGHVVDDKPVRVVSSCQLGIYTFPFDVQNCTLTFGSYVHFGSELRTLQSETAEEALRNSREQIESNGEWVLQGIDINPIILKFPGGDYYLLQYHIILRRRPMLYVVNLLIPSCFLVTVDLFSFLLPPQSVDRSSFKMTLILGYTVFLLMMNDLLPVTGNETPLINVFFSISLALMVASLLETVFITNVQFSSSQYSAVPRWLRILVLDYLAYVVCIPSQKNSNRVTVNIRAPEDESPMGISHISSPSLAVLAVRKCDPGPQKPPADSTLDEVRKLSGDLAAIRHHIDKHFHSSHSSNEWQMIGIIIDRLLFAIYIIFISLSFITIICIWFVTHSSSK
ncbi:5-hydroxytryptamine receptor 3A-like [Genypterus blacodes]|uniref:5-hydroxytryptamine receptor 3A-like n=1 Tax=Genypterus blacodes TaxID=154954 RepID=UPI003F7745BC